MSQLLFSAQYKDNSKLINIKLSLYLFKEEDTFIVYCPALDLSSYGESEKKSLEEFGNICKTYIEYCANKKTLFKDLRKHGWNIKSTKEKKIKAPSLEEMMMKNDSLRDILYNKDYRKIDRPIEIPCM